MIKFIIILILIPSTVYADDWSWIDNSLQGIYRLVHVADWQQTLEITDSIKYKEGNTLLGERPSLDEINLYFAGTLFAHHQISRAIKKPYRTYWQILCILFELDVVSHNEKNGFKVRPNNINNFKIGFNRRF